MSSGYEPIHVFIPLSHFFNSFVDEDISGPWICPLDPKKLSHFIAAAGAEPVIGTVLLAQLLNAVANGAKLSL